ncbi:hypothetical protein [Actinorugispora endophytica]|nr:hypothetical protein [Actinorugispora endophytica]
MNWESSFYELSTIAARQQGLVTAAQAKRVGVPSEALDHFLDARLLMDLDLSVFQLVSSLAAPVYAYPYAAWLATAPELYAWERAEAPHEEVVLSHQSAARLHRIGAGLSLASTAFTAPTEREAPRATIIHVAPLAPHEVTTEGGVPLTTPHRTIVDLVRIGTGHDEVGGVMTRALKHDLVDIRALHSDLVPLAERHAFPPDGPGFVDHFLIGPLRRSLPRPLSPRNLRGLAELRSPDSVRGVEELLRKLAASGGSPAAAVLTEDPGFTRDIAAEIVGRNGPVG